MWYEEYMDASCQRKDTPLSRDCMLQALSCFQEPLLIVDEHFRVHFANEAACRAHGLQHGQMEGSSLPGLFGSTVFESDLLPHLQRCLAGETVALQGRFPCRTPGTLRMNILCTPWHDPEGGSPRVIIRCSVPSRDPAGLPLHQAATVDNFNKFFAHMLDACLYMDVGGRILAANHAAAALLRRSLQELLQMNFARDFCTRPVQFRELLERLDAVETTHEGALEVSFGKQQTGTCQCSLRTVREQHSRILGVEAVLQPVWPQPETLQEPSQYRLFLERRVLERTSELTRSNKLLQDKIVQLEAIKRELSEYRTRLRELAFELSLVEQQERRRLALELHDGIGQDLAMARIRLSSLRGLLVPLGQEGLCDELLELIKKMIDQSRCLIWEMGSPELYELGFEAALEELAEEFQDRHGLQVTCLRYESNTLNLQQDQKIMLFQMVRELLTNVVKHANADRATLEILQEGSEALCSVRDNGKGFSPDAVLAPRRKRDAGFGLFSIRERLDLIGGSLQIDTSNEGTRCLLRMPLVHDPGTGRSDLPPPIIPGGEP